MCISLTCWVVISSLCSFRLGVGLHFAGNGAHNAQLREQCHAFLALEFSSAAGKVVDTTQADLGLLGLQHHHIAFSIWDCYAGLLVEASGEDIIMNTLTLESFYHFL